MHQRTGSTPRSWGLLLLQVVLASAYSTAAATTEGLAGCREILPSEGCDDSSGPKESYTPSPILYVGCKSWPPCVVDDSGGVSPVTMEHRFYDFFRGNDLGAQIEFTPPSPEKLYHLESELSGYCETQNITAGAVNLSLFQYAPLQPKSLKILLLDVDAECVVSKLDLWVPISCYNATENCSKCPPPSPPTTSELNVMADEVVMEREGELSGIVRWSWKEGKGRSYSGEIYHVRVSEQREGGEVRWLEVRGQMEVLLGNISSFSYTISVWRYECGCNASNPMGRAILDPLLASVVFTGTAVLPCPTPSPPQTHSPHLTTSPDPPHPTLSVFTGTAVLPCPTPSPPQTHSPHLTTSPDPHTPRSPSTPHPSPSLTTFTPLPPSTEPVTPTTRSTIEGKTVAIISVSVSATIVVTMVVLIAITVLGRRVYRPRCIDLVVDDPIEHDYTKNPSLDERKLSVLVLYSTQTPAEEARRINELLVCGLGKYNVAVESPDTVGPQQLQKEWIEEGLRERAAVLLVCNRQFQEEWRSNGEGELQVASVVKVMLGSLGDSERRRIKCVYLRKEDKTYSSPSLLLRHPISLEDIMQGLDMIARFVHNAPIYKSVANP